MWKQVEPSLRSRPSTWGLLAVLAVLLVPAAAPAQTAVERDIFVSVLNKADEPITSLVPADFIVREDGRTREVLRVRRATDPIDLAVLIDTSQALGRQVADLRTALERFLEKMAGHAQISLIGLGDRPTILTPYTDDAAKLKKGIGTVFPLTGAGSYVLEGIQETLKGLAKRSSERAAIVVVWVGGVEFSNLSYAAVLTQLEESNVSLHVITVGNAVPPDANTQEGRSREIVFDSGTIQSGGRRQNVLSSMALPDALTKLADELVSQYRITYARPDTLIPPKKIEVSVRQPDVTVRATPVIVRPRDPAK
jgi:VWFA-related protein